MTSAAVRIGVGTRFIHQGEAVEIVEFHPGPTGTEVVLKGTSKQVYTRVCLNKLLLSDNTRLIPDTDGPSSDQVSLERDEFISLYEHQRLTLRDIGAQVGVSRGVVTRLAHDYGVPIRKPDDRARNAIDRDWLYEQYITQHRALPDIARQCGLTAPTVAR
jgi:hypothetical protein